MCLRLNAALRRYSFEIAPGGVVSSIVPKLLFAFMLLLVSPASAGTTFMVFPPENGSKAQTLAWIGEGLAVSISEQLISPVADSISWEERVRFVEASDLPPNAPLSRASMIRVAQKAAADFIVFGSYSGTEDSLGISLSVLDLKSLRLGGEKAASGPLSALPQLENELAWAILSDVANNGTISRDDFRRRMRTVPNAVYASFIGSLAITDESERARTLQKLLDAYHDFPQASYLLGSHYFADSDCSRAIPYLKSALKEAQDFLEAEFMLGTCYLKQGDTAEAAAAYNGFVARNRALEALNNLGVAYLRWGDYALATQNLLEARKLAGADVTVGINMAILRHLQGEDAAARSILEELVKTDPEQGFLQYLHSLVLDAIGEAKQASEALDRARRMGVDPEKMKRQDLRAWTRIFPSWIRRSPITFTSQVRLRH